MSMRITTDQLAELALSSVDLEELAEQLVPQLMELTGARAGSLLIEEKGVLVVHTAYGLKSNRANQARIPLGVGVTGRAAQSDDVQWIPDVGAVENYIEGVPNSEWEWALPLSHPEHDTTVVLDLESNTVDRPGEELRRSIRKRLETVKLSIITRAANTRLRRSYQDDGYSSLMGGEYFIEYLDEWLRANSDRAGALAVLELDPRIEDPEIGSVRELRRALEPLEKRFNSVLERDYFAGRLYGNLVGLFVPDCTDEDVDDLLPRLQENLRDKFLVKKFNYARRDTEEVTGQELIDRAFVELQFGETTRIGPPARGLDEILRSGDIELSAQPILANGEDMVGREILVRGPEGSPLRSPKRLFEAAYQENRVVELDSLIARRSLETVPVEDGETLFLNVERKSIVDEEWRRTLMNLVQTSPRSREVCVEITEHGDMTDLAGPLNQLKEKLGSSIQFAIDDFGTGSSNFEAIIDLSPDVLKIDRSLIRDIHEHFGKRSLIESIVSFSRTTDIRLLAEGIEAKPEMETLTELGIEWAQGYYFAEPEAILVQNGKNGTDPVTEM